MIHRHFRFSDRNFFNTSFGLYLLVCAGFFLRLIILVFAESRLDADESTVGVMALNILEGKDFPLFFYGAAYNGGAAIEAYLGAFVFKVLGPSALSLKLSLLIIWTLTALLFADLCRRHFSARRAFFSVLFFCVSTPFFLEWSIKARGGFAETVLFSILLIWIAEPPDLFKKKLNLQCLSFGIVCGVGFYASEMLLLMMFCSGFWLIIRCDKDKQRLALMLLLLGCLIGFLPLIFYNATHDFANMRSSMLYKLVMYRGAELDPLSLSHLWLSVHFILGKSYVILLPGVFVASVLLAKKIRPLEIGHLFLVHTVVYLLAYWFSGLRYLQIPPARVLYALYPGLAVLLAYAIDVYSNPRVVKRVLPLGALVLYLTLVSVSVGQWISSGVPREESSWRGSWALTDGNELYKNLADLGVEKVYANAWTRWSLLFALRKTRYMDADKPAFGIYYILPILPKAQGRHVAFVLHSGGQIIKEVEKAFLLHEIQYKRLKFHKLVILWGLDASQIHWKIGLPEIISEADWQPMPLKPDGFN